MTEVCGADGFYVFCGTFLGFDFLVSLGKELVCSRAITLCGWHLYLSWTGAQRRALILYSTQDGEQRSELRKSSFGETNRCLPQAVIYFGTLIMFMSLLGFLSWRWNTQTLCQHLKAGTHRILSDLLLRCLFVLSDAQRISRKHSRLKTRARRSGGKVHSRLWCGVS